MPHKCAGCGKAYENYAIEIAEGCPCGSKMFFYQKHAPAASKEQKVTSKFKSEPKIQGAMPGPAAAENLNLMEDVKKAIEDVRKGRKSKKVEFDLDTIRMIEDGVYDIDVGKLMKGEPLIVELGEDGKYHIHVASLFKKRMEELDKEYLEDKPMNDKVKKK